MPFALCPSPFDFCPLPFALDIARSSDSWRILSKTAVPRYSFGDVVVDGEARRVTRNGELLSIPERHFGVLLELLARRETIVSKDSLIAVVWHDVAVTDNSLEQAVSALRRLL